VTALPVLAAEAAAEAAGAAGLAVCWAIAGDRARPKPAASAPSGSRVGREGAAAAGLSGGVLVGTVFSRLSVKHWLALIRLGGLVLAFLVYRERFTS
jgi:hypothetical protein